MSFFTEQGLLNPNFTAPKPVAKVSEKDRPKILRLQSDGDLYKTTKEDGFAFLSHVAPGGPELYTKSVNRKTDHFPQIISELQDLDIPAGSVFMNELVHEVTKGKPQERGRVGKLVGLKSPEEAVKRQKLDDMGPASMIVLMPLAWGGKDVSCLSNRDRFELLLEHFDKRGRGLKYIRPIEILEASLEDAEELIRGQNKEGLVVYGAHGCATEKKPYVRLDGSPRPYRPKDWWKVKDVLEDDFIVYGIRTNELDDLYDLLLAQVDPVTGDWIHCGKVGTGFTNEQKAQVWNLSRGDVVQVGFEYWTKTNKLNQTRFMDFRTRDDKTAEECLYHRNGIRQPLKDLPFVSSRFS